MNLNIISSLKNPILAVLLCSFTLASADLYAGGIRKHGHERPVASAEYSGDSVSFAGYQFAGLPNLGAPSLPAFGQSVMVKFKFGKLGSTLSATYHNGEHLSSLMTTSNQWGINSTSYDLTASFDKNGAFITGNVSITGQIPGLGINTTQTLMTADLTAFGKSASGNVYGFNTDNISCNSIVDAAVNCTTSEVVYFALNNAQKSMTKSWSTKGIALTSVPVPAAAWLLGTGLLGLVGCSRRSVNHV